MDALRNSVGETSQKQIEKLTELGDHLEKMKEDMEKYSIDEDKDKSSPTKFVNPESFLQCAWNVAGPSKGSLLIYLNDLKKEHFLGK